MGKEKIKTGTTFPLTYAYQFLTDKGFQDLVDDIRKSQETYKSYTSGLRRAKIVNLLNENNLLDEFIKQYWEFGLSQKGINKIKRLNRLYDSFISDAEDGEEDEEETVEGSSFAYEEDLKNANSTRKCN